MKNDQAIVRPNFAILGGGEISVDLAMELMRRWDNHDALLEACKLALEHWRATGDVEDQKLYESVQSAVANADKL